ncbi:hypothetical protein KC19_2G166200 [Ceratodon purpureus]|uniref:HMA domain-containing protein n=1 Tax=Ceratodon purpureus TaxID=3225 RepID=A0A8T0IWD0_CERPU|nr:hypothetical protein KC19_2G166200 [Ceratodon purpureus]
MVYKRHLRQDCNVIQVEVVELYVVMHCEACAASVKRAIKKIPGVESYKIDYYEQKVTVIGDVTREDVWRRIHKTGKRVTLIPKPAPPKEEPKEEKKEETKEEKKEEEEEKKEEKTEEKQETKVEITEVKVEEKKQEKSEETKEETKVVDTKETTVVVRRKSMYWPAVRLWRFLIPREVKVHETKETVVETKDEKKEETKEEKKEEPKSEEKKQPKRPKEPEWMPMFVSAPYYTLPSRFY